MRAAAPVLLAATLAALGLCAGAAIAVAEDAPAAGAPTRWLTVGGEALGSVASDDAGYFDDTSYGQSAMRMGPFTPAAPVCRWAPVIELIPCTSML